MRRFLRRAAVLGLSVAAAGLLGTTTADAATNPYTAASACAADFGGSWVSVSDGHRVAMAGSTTVADVYLMYNRANGHNCVTTIKRVNVGTATSTEADLEVQRSGSVFGIVQSNPYKYYAAVDYAAAGQCVRYEGGTTYGGKWYYGSRTTMGNCG